MLTNIFIHVQNDCVLDLAIINGVIFFKKNFFPVYKSVHKNLYIYTYTYTHLYIFKIPVENLRRPTFKHLNRCLHGPPISLTAVSNADETKNGCMRRLLYQRPFFRVFVLFFNLKVFFCIPKTCYR